MAISKTMYDPELISDLINKVNGRSSLAKLSPQKPIPFTGTKEFTFSLDKEIDIVAENGAKSNGGFTMEPVTIIPIKFEYGARISDEFMYASEEKKIDFLTAFNDGFAKKVARGLDIAAMHGINPRTGAASAVVGTNHFDSQVTTAVTYAAASADDNLEDAILAVQAANGTVTGMALSNTFASAMGKILKNDNYAYPEFKFGANPGSFAGKTSDVNNTLSVALSGATTIDYAIVGDFESGFKWGYSKEVPLKIIDTGCPDNDTDAGDLAGHNQVYLRAEVYLGWGILLPDHFAKITGATA